jgi:hypothetical protein
MPELYEQFFGSNPGMIVELVNDSESPYLARTQDGFDFLVSADDFKNFYRKVGADTPERWRRLVTDQATGLADSAKLAKVMEILAPLYDIFRDFDKARSFLREAVSAVNADGGKDIAAARAGLTERGWNGDALTQGFFSRLAELSEDVKQLILGHTCAVVPFFADAAIVADAAGRDLENLAFVFAQSGADVAKSGDGSASKRASKKQRGGMKNVELSLDGNALTILVDLSKEFGPSKSGKTTIIASSAGNKTIPGREEKIGLNVYKQEAKKPAKGRKQEFKNVRMDVEGDLLKIFVDLSSEIGPSKSGQTILIATTEGNQLVWEREEKIGLNIYRKVE